MRSPVSSAEPVAHRARARVPGYGHAAGRQAPRQRRARCRAAGPGRSARSVRRPSAAQPQPPPRPNNGPSEPCLQTVAAFTYARLPRDIYSAPADSGRRRRGSGQAVDLLPGSWDYLVVTIVPSPIILMRTFQRTGWLRRSKRGPGRGLQCRRGPARPLRGASEDVLVPLGAPNSTMVVATRALPRPGETSALTFIKDWAPLLLLVVAYE